MMPPTHELPIMPIQIEHVKTYHACLDSVCREGHYLSSLKAPPLESTYEFVNHNVEHSVPQFVALDEQRVVGWCDIRPMQRDCFAHVGVLGMGVHADYRRRSLGWRLLETTLNQARQIGLQRVELDVFTTNTGAVMLYDRFGFSAEGIKKRAVKLSGRYLDIFMMGKWIAP